MSNRGRAWRRSQRARIISKREARLPEPNPVWPVQVWQLHTPGGEPMYLFHRQTLSPNQSVYRTWPEAVRQEWVASRPEAEPLLVTRTHRTYCIEHGPYEHHEWRTGERYWVTPTEPCTCTTLNCFWLGSQPGFTWVPVRRYIPTQRPRAPGRVAKTAPETNDYPAVKNWKLLYTRSVKAKRARQLGYDLVTDLEVVEP